MKALAVALSLLLVACSPNDTSDTPAGSPVKAQGLPDYSHVYEFRLEDGTRCVSTGYRGGVTCEWGRASK